VKGTAREHNVGFERFGGNSRAALGVYFFKSEKGSTGKQHTWSGKRTVSALMDDLRPASLHALAMGTEKYSFKRHGRTWRKNVEKKGRERKKLKVCPPILKRCWKEPNVKFFFRGERWGVLIKWSAYQKKIKPLDRILGEKKGEERRGKNFCGELLGCQGGGGRRSRKKGGPESNLEQRICGNESSFFSLRE